MRIAVLSSREEFLLATNLIPFKGIDASYKGFVLDTDRLVDHRIQAAVKSADFVICVLGQNLLCLPSVVATALGPQRSFVVVPLTLGDVTIPGVTVLHHASGSDSIAISEAETVIHKALSALGPRPAKRVLIAHSGGSRTAEDLYHALVAVYKHQNVQTLTEEVSVHKDSDGDIGQAFVTPAVVLVIMDTDWWCVLDRVASHPAPPSNSFSAVLADVLRRDDVLVIPVFVNGMPIPTSANMPEHIRSLVRHNGVRLTHDDWEAGMKRLRKAIDEVMVND